MEIQQKVDKNMAAFLKMANAMKKASNSDKESSTTSSEDKKSSKILSDLVKKGKTAAMMGES